MLIEKKNYTLQPSHEKINKLAKILLKAIFVKMRILQRTRLKELKVFTDVKIIEKRFYRFSITIVNILPRQRANSILLNAQRGTYT